MSIYLVIRIDNGKIDWFMSFYRCQFVDNYIHHIYGQEVGKDLLIRTPIINWAFCQPQFYCKHHSCCPIEVEITSTNLLLFYWNRMIQILSIYLPIFDGRFLLQLCCRSQEVDLLGSSIKNETKSIKLPTRTIKLTYFSFFVGY